MSYDFGGGELRFEQKERHSKEDALSDFDFELLYEGAQRLPDMHYALQCMFVIIVAGRLGLRRSEISHMRESWVDWDDRMIRIPRHQDCECGDCRQKAEQSADHNHVVDFQEALDYRWHPKTEMSVREIPFGFDTRIELVMERFFEKYDEFPHSVMAVTRRVNRAAENAQGLDEKNVYPHSLRATAASFHAGRGLGVVPLQSMFGWCNLATPMKYVKHSGKNTARELERTHMR